MEKIIVPTVDILREIFDYDSITGGLTWRWRPREHFSNERGWRQRNGRAGKVAGWVTARGSIQVIFKIGDVKHRHYAHRIGWALYHGRWPENEIDHRDGDGGNNRIENLREATRLQNMHNLGRQKGKTRLLGAYPNGSGGTFCSRIKVDKVDHYLGNFPTERQAHEAYLAAKARLHPFQPVPRDE